MSNSTSSSYHNHPNYDHRVVLFLACRETRHPCSLSLGRGNSSNISVLCLRAFNVLEKVTNVAYVYVHTSRNEQCPKHTSFEGKSNLIPDEKYSDKRQSGILTSCEFNQQLVYGLSIYSNICVNGMLNVLPIFRQGTQNYSPVPCCSVAMCSFFDVYHFN